MVHIMMTVLYFFLIVFSHAMFYRFNCIMFVLKHRFVLWHVGLRGGVRPVLHNFKGRVCSAILLYGEGCQKWPFLQYITCEHTSCGLIRKS